MGRKTEKELDDWQRLLAMREHLGVRARPDQPTFEAEVVEASVSQVSPIIERHAGECGEAIIESIAAHLGVRFEEVHSDHDIVHLERKYLVAKKELGFGLLAHELKDPGVDAVLIQRMHAAHDAPDRWVAVLNMQQTRARAYWSRPHELTHRLAEPPQRRLPFYRHRKDAQNRLERIIDLGAAELAFPATALGPRVRAVGSQELTWDLITALRLQFAPTASLLCAAKAIFRFWPQPAFLLQAKFQGRASGHNVDVALRVTLEGRTDGTSSSGVQFFRNMRVPPTSPLSHTFETGRNVSDVENLKHWVTSSGSGLPDRRALTSGLNLGSVAYGIVSLLE
jgi:hypothetical protein